jgi:hypothetical protein
VFDLLLNHTSKHFPFVTAQMNAKSGLKLFGQAGADVIMKELQQLIVLNVMHGCSPASLSTKQRRKALRYLMFLKEKRCGQIKG